MLNRTRCSSMVLKISLALAAAAMFGTPMGGQEVPAVNVGNSHITGVPDDWTHHHLVFANPGTEERAFRKGTHENWSRVVNDPRYAVQQLKKGLPAHGPAADDVAFRNSQAAEIARSNAVILEKPLSTSNSNTPKLQKDWSMTLAGATATGAMAPNAYPATFSYFPAAGSCAHDYALFPTGLAGTSTQATILGFTNIYKGTCSGLVPSNAFAYNTGGTATQSPVLSLDGTQVAYVQSVGTVANLVLLKISTGSGGTAGAPAKPTSVTAANYLSCVAPCYTSMPFSGGANSTNSAPFYVYFGGPDGDTIFVGDNSGKLHKFTNVFFGTPAEVTTTWPVTVDTGFILTSPVYDSNSGNVFVADSNGKLSRITTAGVVTSSAKLSAAAATSSMVDSPLIDSEPATPAVYVFVGDSTASTSLVEKFTTTFASGATASATANVTSGSGAAAATKLYIGAFDNLHYTIGATAGNMYVCGSHATGARPELVQIPMANFGTGVTQANAITSGSATCSPASEFLGSKANTTLSAAISTTAAATTTLSATLTSPGRTTTTLNGAITATATTIVVNSATGITAGSRLLIGTEDILVSGVAGTTLTVNRGIFGTTAAAHTSGTTVTILANSTFGVASATNIAATDFVQIGTELMYVTGVAGLNVTAVRAVAGTTQATHANNSTVTIPTPLSVASILGITNGDYVQVDSEIMQVSAISTSAKLAVTRGALGTTGATHLTGVAVQDIQDWLYLSVTALGSDTGCTGACLYNYSITTGTAPTNSVTGIAATGGTSGVVVDNALTGAGESQIYYTTLGNATCGGNTSTGTGTHGCAVQASQSGLQ
jgi:hypothetical protein